MILFEPTNILFKGITERMSTKEREREREREKKKERKFLKE
jgi:hypothetical protein